MALFDEPWTTKKVAFSLLSVMRASFIASFRTATETSVTADITRTIAAVLAQLLAAMFTLHEMPTFRLGTCTLVNASALAAMHSLLSGRLPASQRAGKQKLAPRGQTREI